MMRLQFALIFLFVFALFWSCDSNEDDFPNTPMDPQDTMIVVDTTMTDTTVGDTTVGDTTVGDTTVIGDTTVGDTTVLNPPIIQTPTPVIHLADNLDEPAQLGW